MSEASRGQGGGAAGGTAGAGAGGATGAARAGADGGAGGDERRSARRVEVEIWVEETTERELYLQRGGNVSEGGLFLEGTVPHAIGTMVNLKFTLPGQREPIRVRGEIANAGRQEQLGMGVRFVGLGAEDARRIREFVRGGG